jgi:hypothetical protein
MYIACARTDALPLAAGLTQKTRYASDLTKNARFVN